MRHFIVAKQSEVVRRTWGGANIAYSVYEIMRRKKIDPLSSHDNILKFRCTFSICTSAYKGVESEALNALARTVPDVIRDEQWVPGKRPVIPAKYHGAYYRPSTQPFRITAV